MHDKDFDPTIMRRRSLGIPGSAKIPATAEDYTRLPDEFLGELHKTSPTCYAFQKGEICVLIDRAERRKCLPGQDTETSIHLSISAKTRYPTWDEIKEARYRFMPRDRDAYMILPPAHAYLDRMPTTFHLFMPSLIDPKEDIFDRS